MANVWAVHTGTECTFTESHATGWDHVFSFSTLEGLNEQLEALRLRGQVEKLGIVAHGDQPGQVRLGTQTLRVETLRTFHPPLDRLRWFLRRQASTKLAFYACIAGAWDAGSEFLRALSRLLPGRTIIGFTDWGMCGAGAQVSHPGRISPNATGGRGFIWMEGRYAKWARDNEIVRWPDVPVGDQRPQ